MPVVFEQPDPVGFLSAPAQAGGYVAQYNADRQFALQAAALQQHAQQANAGLQLQRQLGTAQVQQQGMALAERGMVSPAQQFQAREQQAAIAQQGQVQDQRFQQQLALQRSQFSQADQLQLARLKQGDSFIDQQANVNGWSPEEIAEAKSRLHGVMGPLQMKAARAAIAQQDAKTQQLQQLGQQEAAHAGAYNRVSAAAQDQTERAETDEHGNPVLDDHGDEIRTRVNPKTGQRERVTDHAAVHGSRATEAIKPIDHAAIMEHSLKHVEGAFPDLKGDERIQKAQEIADQLAAKQRRDQVVQKGINQGLLEADGVTPTYKQKMRWEAEYQRFGPMNTLNTTQQARKLQVAGYLGIQAPPQSVASPTTLGGALGPELGARPTVATQLESYAGEEAESQAGGHPPAHFKVGGGWSVERAAGNKWRQKYTPPPPSVGEVAGSAANSAVSTVGEFLRGLPGQFRYRAPGGVSGGY